jgi:3',5'-cyclic AMP phosphodiesterase CpdA
MITRTMLVSGVSVRLNRPAQSHSIQWKSTATAKARILHFTLAHFSDVHLGPVPVSGAWQHFRLKRVIGSLSWHFNRRRLHRAFIADALRESVLAQKPHHIACTGDLVNIAAWPEFPRAAQWLAKLAPPQMLSLVPGNHDCYVGVPFEEGLSHFAPWMRDSASTENTLQFPYIHLRRNIALIGVNSGQPQSLWRAAGTVGEQQRRDLGHHLKRLGDQGFCRVVLIHHPPLPNLARDRKALTDAASLQDTLKQSGCELVLHGHNHHFMHNQLTTVSGTAHVIGAPTASMAPRGTHETAGWNLFHIKRQSGAWQIDLQRHSWKPETRRFEATSPALLSPA